MLEEERGEKVEVPKTAKMDWSVVRQENCQAWYAQQQCDRHCPHRDHFQYHGLIPLYRTDLQEYFC